MQETSTKPYMLRALYEWCTDNGFTPHIAVRVDGRTRVPMQFVRDGEIVLNISFNATSGLHMRNDLIEFKARFGGSPYDIAVPVSNVLAIYALENGQGMAFPVEDGVDDAQLASDIPGAEVREDEDIMQDDSSAPTPKVPPVLAVIDDPHTLAHRHGDAPEKPENDGGPPDGEGPKTGRPHLKVVK